VRPAPLRHIATAWDELTECRNGGTARLLPKARPAWASDEPIMNSAAGRDMFDPTRIPIPWVNSTKRGHSRTNIDLYLSVGDLYLSVGDTAAHRHRAVHRLQKQGLDELCVERLRDVRI
jgi:hypothetical protein